MARKARKQKKDFLDGIVSRLTGEAVDFLVRNCGEDTAIVDLTALSDGTESRYRVRTCGTDALVSIRDLRSITGRVAVFASLAPDMFLRLGRKTEGFGDHQTAPSVELRQESRKIIRSMLAGATITRIVDRKDFFPFHACEYYGLEGFGRYIVYGEDGLVSVSAEPEGELYEGDWTLDIRRNL